MNKKQPKTKEEVEADIKAILAKDKRYKDAKVTLVFKEKRKQTNG